MLISPTVYQKKYGAPPTPIAIIISSYRSELTPISAHKLANPSANFSREERIAYQQSKTLMVLAWLFAYLEELLGEDIEEEENENGFEEWLDNWTKSLNNLTKAFDACLQNFNICVHMLNVWETATRSSLYGDRY